MNEVDAMFAAAREIAEVIVANRSARRQAIKDASNARRRARYAAAPPKPNAPTAVIHVGDDDWYEPGCRCQFMNNPPCSWCEGGGEA